MVGIDIPALLASSALLIKIFSRYLFREFIFSVKLKASKKEKPLPFPDAGFTQKHPIPCTKKQRGAWLRGLARRKRDLKILS
jgi:hypothetical protein